MPRRAVKALRKIAKRGGYSMKKASPSQFKKVVRGLKNKKFYKPSSMSISKLLKKDSFDKTTTFARRSAFASVGVGGGVALGAGGYLGYKKLRNRKRRR